jgi:hypothetical protein
MVDEKWGMARHAAFRRRTMPDALRASCALELADCWCRSSAFQVLSMACERARDRAPARCLISARRRAVLRLLRPPAFPGRMTERTSDDCQVSSGLRRAGRKLGPQAQGSAVRKTRSVMLAGAGRTTRSSVCSGSVPSGERRTGANGRTVAHPTRSCGAQMSSKERRCSNETISTGSPVGLQACYKGSLATPPANSLQFEGKSEKVWLMSGEKRGDFWGGWGCRSICNIMFAERGAGSRGHFSG